MGPRRPRRERTSPTRAARKAQGHAEVGGACDQTLWPNFPAATHPVTRDLIFALSRRFPSCLRSTACAPTNVAPFATPPGYFKSVASLKRRADQRGSSRSTARPRRTLDASTYAVVRMFHGSGLGCLQCWGQCVQLNVVSGVTTD